VSGIARQVPVGTMLGEVLTTFSARLHAFGGETPFFTTRAGARVTADQLQHHFRRLCTRVGVCRADGGRYQPRMHDLRHSFAVHRLTSWYRQGADVQRLLPHLSTYLGHVEIADTQVYLTLTPELLAEAGKRFERYAWEERHHA